MYIYIDIIERVLKVIISMIKPTFDIISYDLSYIPVLLYVVL